MSAPTPPSTKVPAPPQRSAGLRVLAVLGKLVALAGTAALTFQFGARGLAAGLLFGFVIPWLIALRPKRPIRRHPFRGGLHKLRWYPQLRPWAIVSGLIGGLGTVMVLQQFSIRAITNALLIRGLIGGLLGGVVIPSITWAFVVRRMNRGVRRAMATPAAAMMAITALVVLGMAGAALAEADGPCAATFLAQDVSDVDSTDEADAFSVHPEDTATFDLRAPVPAVDSTFEIHYGPLSIPIDSGTGDSASASVKVDDYDWAGAGLYLVTGEATLSDGSTCSGAVLVDVQVDDPLRTVGGATAATLAAAGVLGVMGVALRNASDATQSLRLAKAALNDTTTPGMAVAAGTAAATAASQAEETAPAPPPPPPPPPPVEVPPWPVTVASDTDAASLEADEPMISDAEMGAAAGAGAAAAAAMRSSSEVEEEGGGEHAPRDTEGDPRGRGGKAGPRGATGGDPGEAPDLEHGPSEVDVQAGLDHGPSEVDVQAGLDHGPSEVDVRAGLDHGPSDVATPAAEGPAPVAADGGAASGGPGPETRGGTAATEHPPAPSEAGGGDQPLASGPADAAPGESPFALRDEVIERVVDPDAFEHDIPTGADDESREAERLEDETGATDPEAEPGDSPEERSP
jgi:hypothetical protein